MDPWLPLTHGVTFLSFPGCCISLEQKVRCAAPSDEAILPPGLWFQHTFCSLSGYELEDCLPSPHGAGGESVSLIVGDQAA